MKNLGIHLSWVCVKDLKSAVQFYTQVAGFSLLEESAEYGWAELQGAGGCRLGIAQENDSEPFVHPGANGIIAITVDNIQNAIEHFRAKGARLLGKVMEVPGHVKIQTCKDPDGNMIQLVEML